jgi:hypothetical protein
VVLTPGLCLVVGIYSLVAYKPFTYNNYVYPWWSELIGWSMALSSIGVIPVYALYIVLTRTGSIREVTKKLIKYFLKR